MPLPLRNLRLRSDRTVKVPASIVVGDKVLPVTLRRNARAKRMILRLAPGATGILVTAPKRMADATIAEFITRHHGWLVERAARSGNGICVAAGAQLPFRGETVRLVHVGGRRVTRLDEDGTRIIVGGEAQHFSRRILDFLKREAKADLTARVEIHAASVGLSPAAITLKDTKSRWGSCTHDRKLAFSWRIVMAPPHVLDYLAAHEVAHFVEMNHSPAFWALCRSLCPGMDEGRAWLRANGASLHAVRFA